MKIFLRLKRFPAVLLVCQVCSSQNKRLLHENIVELEDFSGKNIGSLDDSLWIKVQGNQIPENAFVGGDHFGEDLLVGRATHMTALTPGLTQFNFR